MANYSLAELCIASAAQAWCDDGEVLATGIGLVPRLAASLAQCSCNPQLLLTDGEAYLVREPVPVGKRNGYTPKVEGWMPYGRVFDLLYRGQRHAMTGPAQIDRWGQTNISCIGDWHRPKAQLLGVRGFPGNTIHHANSMFVPRHSTRVFVPGEVDMVSGVGYKPERWGAGMRADFVDLRLVVSELCVLDFQGADHAMRVISLHPGVSLEQVRENTAFPLEVREPLGATAPPDAQQLEIIARLDPHNLRAAVFPDNPPGDARLRPAS